MYRTIPNEQIEKAKRLLSEGHSLRSVEFLSGVSFTTVRKLYLELDKSKKTEKQEHSNGYFNVDEMDWLTGWKQTWETIR